MSKINPGLYSSEDQTWMTPPDFIQKLLTFEGRDRFDLDPCCSEANIPAQRRIVYPENDGLNTRWRQYAAVDRPLVFMNPPYGKMLKMFIQKAYEESMSGCRIWALIPARTETIYQHQYGLTKAGFTVFLKGRLHFLQQGESKGSAPFPTMLLYYGDDWVNKLRRWEDSEPIAGTVMINGWRL